MLPTASTGRAKLPLPMTAEEVSRRGWDAVDVVFVTGDAYIDHPSFAHGDPGARAGGGRISSWHRQPAGLAIVRGLEAVRPAAAVLRDQRRQHGLDDQPLHGQQEGAQRRRLLAGRQDRHAPGPGDAGLLPAGPRGLPWCAGDRRRRRGLPAAAGPLRLLERQGPPLDPARLQGRPGRVRYGRGEHPRDRPPLAGRRDRARPARHARRGLRARRVGATPRTMRWRLPSYEEVVADKPAFAEATRIIHNETNPYNARRLVQRHGKQSIVANPPSLPISSTAMDRDLRPAVHTSAASQSTPSRSPPSR